MYVGMCSGIWVYRGDKGLYGLYVGLFSHPVMGTIRHYGRYIKALLTP